MTVVTTQRSADTQVGYVASAGAAYTAGGSDIAFAAGQAIVIRYPTQIPKGSTINSAVISLQITAKDSSVTGTSYHTLRAELTGDSKILVTGDVGVGNRIKTVSSTAVVVTYPASPPTPPILTFSVKAMLDEILAQPDYQPGGYVTFYLMCDNEAGSDNGVVANNGFAQLPRLIVDLTAPTTDQRTDFNIFQNSEWDVAVNAVEPANPTPYWSQNEFLGFFVPSANFGTMSVDSMMYREPTQASLKFVTAAPPSGAKSTGPTCGVTVDLSETWIYCGWVYVSSAIPTSVRVQAELVFNSPQTQYIIADRSKWVPFCTMPFSPGGGFGALWPTITIFSGYSAGQEIWITEPTFMKSKHQQLPFNGLTPEGNFIDHQSTVSHQQGVRLWTPRTTMMVGGVPKRMPTWTKRADGILQLSEPVKGGPQIGQLPAGQTVGGLPAGMTVTELL